MKHKIIVKQPFAVATEDAAHAGRCSMSEPAGLAAHHA